MGRCFSKSEYANGIGGKKEEEKIEILKCSILD
jgi:hypothetical protein